MKKQKKYDARIKVTKDGPYFVFGSVPLAVEEIVPDAQDYLLAWKKIADFSEQKTYSLCRCGKSKNAPFCDNSHISTQFVGTETADAVPFSKKAERYDGPDLELLDAQELCASAHFCTRADGVWKLIQESDDPKKRKILEKEVADCPAGRLVLLNRKTGKEVDVKFNPSIALVEDALTGVSGPIWVKGRISIESADGKLYELRNRVTLCRCGKSRNKPFCDGAHISYGFKAKKK